ncbi:hypothetical protein JCM5350_007120 [Sporobolomyces pararoseus]
MPAKRKATKSRAYESEEEDSDYEVSVSTSTKKKKKKDPSPSPAFGEVAARMRKAGIGPRSVAFGGEEGLSAIAAERYRGGREKVSLRASGDSSEPKKPRRRKSETKDLGNSLLCFQPLKPRAPQVLKYPQPQVLVTTFKDKKKKKKKKDDSDSSEVEEDSEDDENAVNFGRIIEKPERVQRAVVAGPSPQVPWSINAFGKLSVPSNRPPRKKTKVEEEEEDDSDEDEKKKKKKKEKGPKKPTRTYRDDKALLVIHNKRFEAKSKIDTYKTIMTHRPGAGKTMNARFLCMMYTEPVNQRLSLRIAITNAEPTAENYAKTENIIWVQDFPEVDQSKLKDNRDSTIPSRNTTHTDFSVGFFKLFGGGTSLPQKSESESFVAMMEENFDFSTSASVQPVLSVAGKYDDEGEALEAGGFTSLAKAMTNFGVSHKGAWRIEYITPLSLPINEKFLKNLYAAAMGVSPLELIEQETEAAKQAKKEYNREKIKLGYPTCDRVEASIGSSIGQYYLRFEINDDLDFDRIPSNDARRICGSDDYTILHDFELKSGRINHSNVLLIYHTNPQGPVKYEAFVYIGSHTPTIQSWGKYKTSNGTTTLNLANSEFGVLTRLAADSWKELTVKMNEFVPYKRKSLEMYEKNMRDRDDDVPFTPKPREKKTKGKKKKGNETE